MMNFIQGNLEVRAIDRAIEATMMFLIMFIPTYGFAALSTMPVL